ncbi:DUF3592 domain-containing protein [Chloroflexus sp.]|uniref:DUF3592 domain-containing protein n=1 Tax=Chloroflexus sp. TaxID=1904827 RepID=UPI0026163824|nr:DUF3592 domain-containing protein [uncultured Chloroflexus sp.]
MKVRFKNPLSQFIFSFITIPVGVAMLIFGNWWHSQNQAFVDIAQPATGRVVELVAETRRNNEGRQATYYYPVIAFTAIDGTAMQVKSSTGSNPPSHRVGDTVSILYNPQNPAEMHENSFWSLWFPSYLILGFGGLFLLVGVSMAINGLLWMIGTVGLLGFLIQMWRRNRSSGG